MNAMPTTRSHENVPPERPKNSVRGSLGMKIHMHIYPVHSDGLNEKSDSSLTL